MATESEKAAVRIGLGVAICDQKDNLLFRTKGLLQDVTSSISKIRD